MTSGVFALADQFAGRRLGFINAAIYRIGRGQAQRQAFHDVTSGNSSMRVMGSHKRPFDVRGFKEERGWDEATGWGSPDVATLVPLLVRYDHSGDGSRL